jgi:hypothetical protein
MVTMVGLDRSFGAGMLLVVTASHLLPLGHAFPPPNNLDVSTDVNVRHFVEPFDRNGDDVAFQSSGAEFSLMQSSCRPEQNGYFGGTFGIPIQLEYGFEMEAYAVANFDHALEAVREHIIDALVSETFPNVCGLDRRRQMKERSKHTSGRVSGFKFEKDLQIYGCKCDTTEWDMFVRNQI